MEQLVLWKFKAFVGMKAVNGVFAASDYAVQEAVGLTVTLGDDSGDVILLKREQFERVTDEDSFVQRFLTFKLEYGYNPMDWLQD